MISTKTIHPLTIVPLVFQTKTRDLELHPIHYVPLTHNFNIIEKLTLSVI